MATKTKIHPSLKSLTVAISTLTLDPANARKHPDRNLDVIKASLTDFGQRKPIIVRREGMVVEAGNGTLAAAIALGWKDIAAVVVDDDAVTATRFSIVDNRSAELAEWDEENLGTLLSALMANDVNMDDIGFNPEELALISKAAGGEDEAVAKQKDLNPIIRYELIFDTVEQQDRFYRWLKLLKESMGDMPTVASRLDSTLQSQGL